MFKAPLNVLPPNKWINQTCYSASLEQLRIFAPKKRAVTRRLS